MHDFLDRSLYIGSYLLKSKSYYTTEKYVMKSQKEGQNFGLRDQSKIFLFLPLLTLFVRLVCVWSLTVAIVSSNIEEDFIVSKLYETFRLPSVLNILFLLTTCPEKIDQKLS